MNWKAFVVLAVLLLAGGAVALTAVAFAFFTAATIAAPVLLPLLVMFFVLRLVFSGNRQQRLERHSRKQQRKLERQRASIIIDHDTLVAEGRAAPISQPALPARAPGKLGEIDESIRLLRETAAHVQSEIVKQHVASICATAGLVRDYLGDRPAKLAVHGHTVALVLSSASAVLNEYRNMAGATAQRAMHSIERLEQQTLPKVDQAMEKLYDQLVADEVLSIDVAMKTLEDTLALEGIAGDLTFRHQVPIPIPAR
jgi:ABC-type multidrug transport system fused ATPase/permease subunit